MKSFNLILQMLSEELDCLFYTSARCEATYKRVLVVSKWWLSVDYSNELITLTAQDKSKACFGIQPESGKIVS